MSAAAAAAAMSKPVPAARPSSFLQAAGGGVGPSGPQGGRGEAGVKLLQP